MPKGFVAISNGEAEVFGESDWRTLKILAYFGCRPRSANLENMREGMFRARLSAGLTAVFVNPRGVPDKLAENERAPIVVFAEWPFAAAGNPTTEQDSNCGERNRASCVQRAARASPHARLDVPKARAFAQESGALAILDCAGVIAVSASPPCPEGVPASPVEDQPGAGAPGGKGGSAGAASSESPLRLEALILKPIGGQIAIDGRLTREGVRWEQYPVQR